MSLTSSVTHELFCLLHQPANVCNFHYEYEIKLFHLNSANLFFNGSNVILHITVSSHERYYVSNHWQFAYLFVNFFRLTAKTASKFYITGTSGVEPMGTTSVERCLISIGTPMLKIRRSRDRLIFNMGILIPEKDVFVLRQGPVVPSPRPRYAESVSLA